jgi:Short C-terminal domain
VACPDLRVVRRIENFSLRFATDVAPQSGTIDSRHVRAWSTARAATVDILLLRGIGSGAVAEEVLITGSQDRNRAKIRHPVGVWALSVVTIGVYSWFWWYYINRELRDLGRARNVSGLGDSPGLSCAAWTIGGWLLYIPFVWTIVTTTIRIQRAQRLACKDQTLSGWIAGLLWVFTLGIGGMIYTQVELNRIWRTQPLLSPFGQVGDADLERLEKLTSLKESGALSQEEFDAEKAKLMPQVQPMPEAQPPQPSTEDTQPTQGRSPESPPAG